MLCRIVAVLLVWSEGCNNSSIRKGHVTKTTLLSLRYFCLSPHTIYLSSEQRCVSAAIEKFVDLDIIVVDQSPCFLVIHSPFDLPPL